MKRLFTPLLITALFLVMQAGTAWGAMSDYVFTQSTGTATDMTGSTVAIPAGFSYDDFSSGPFNIGFTFRLDGTSYTQFGVGSNGMLSLGSSTPQTTAYTNINQAPVNPVIAGFWDDHVPSGAGIRYTTTGLSGSRVLTVEWQTYLWCIYTGGSTVVDYTWQVRLYEGTNKIEFLYVNMSSAYTTNGNGQIGVATSSSNFAAIAVGSPSQVSYISTAQNNIRSSATPIAANTLFTLNPCQKNIGIAGVVAQGGTVAMNDADLLLGSQSTQRGSSGSFQPFTTSLGNNSCGNRTVTYTLSGANAADYQISPTGGTISGNGSQTPTIIFTPRALGVRSATLTVRDDNGFSRTYTLSATGTTRIQWSGNIAQGGTANANNGDTLLSSKSILRGTTATFTPVTVRNFGTDASAAPAPITATITDPTGQYTIDGPASALLASGQSYTPVSRFTPTGVGAQNATLTIVAEGETRVFPLKAFAAAPSGEFFVNNARLAPSSGLFINTFGCVGEVANTQQLIVVNTGSGDFQINAIDSYRTDTSYGQGVPRYPLSRDRFGNVIPVNDYFVTDQPGVAPSTSNPMPQLPIVIREGQSRTLYITYVGQEPGKRFARAFVRTNGQNFNGTNTNGTQTEGLLTFDLFGSGIGGTLSDRPTGGEIKLGVSMLPTGVPGGRTTTLRITTATGEVIDIAVTGEAGIQSFTVSPGRLFVGTAIIIGTESRAMVAISNTGTLPIRLNPPTITGPGVLDYRLGAFPRLVIEPGATEYLEITYAPLNLGQSIATLTISSDAGTRTVSLEGTSTKTRRVDADPTAIVPGRERGQPETTLNPNLGSTSSDVRLELYDGAGRLVRALASGTQDAGEHRLTVDVSELSAGVYHCRLITNGVEITRNVVVVR